MSLPYHRGHLNSAEMNQRGNGNWGTREQRVEEGNRTLMEEENDRQLVSGCCSCVVSYVSLSIYLFVHLVLPHAFVVTKRMNEASKCYFILIVVIGGAE